MLFRPEIAAYFVHALTGSPESAMTFQTFDDNNDRGDKSLARHFHGSVSSCANTIDASIEAGAGVFYCVNHTDGHGRSAANVTGLRALFVDKDNGLLDPGLIRLWPSLRVQSSPGKEHAFWLLHPGEPREHFAEAQRNLIAHFDSDKSVIDLCRVLRLPGTLHQKVDTKKGLTGARHLVQDIWIGDLSRRFTIAEIVSAYPRKSQAPKTNGAAHPNVTGRNVTLTSIAGRLRADGASAEALRAALLLANRQLPDPIEEHEVDKIANSVARYEPKRDDGFTAAFANGLAAKAPMPGMAPVSQPWTQYLVTDAKGAPKSCLANGMTILENHELWRGVLAMNVRAAEIWIMAQPPCDHTGRFGPYPRPLGEGDYARIAKWLTYAHGLGDVSLNPILVAVAEYLKFDPVIQYLDYCKALWLAERTPRLDTMLSHYCGAYNAPEEYLAIAGRKWMIQCVARAMWPGCQGDATLVLEGAQEAGKTSYFRTLGGEWFGENPPKDLGQPMTEFIRGPWIVEFGELSSFTRSEIEDVKAFLTNKVDRIRPAYARVTGNFPRRCSFGATTNLFHYLVDVTGNRRFWPVVCADEILIEQLARDRDLLWGEAVCAYDDGEQWHLTPDERPMFIEQQKNRVAIDSILEEIEKALNEGVRNNAFGSIMLGAGEWAIVPKAESVTVGELMKHVLSDRTRDTRFQNRTQNALRQMGWRYSNDTKRWHRPKVTE